jgi:hypothetical protein
MIAPKQLFEHGPRQCQTSGRKHSKETQDKLTLAATWGPEAAGFTSSWFLIKIYNFENFIAPVLCAFL